MTILEEIKLDRSFTGLSDDLINEYISRSNLFLESNYKIPEEVRGYATLLYSKYLLGFNGFQITELNLKEVGEKYERQNYLKLFESLFSQYKNNTDETISVGSNVFDGFIIGGDV